MNNNKNTAICGNNPKADNCDIVQYATRLKEKDAPKMTVGEQKGYTKKTVQGIIEANRKK